MSLAQILIDDYSSDVLVAMQLNYFGTKIGRILIFCLYVKSVHKGFANVRKGQKIIIQLTVMNPNLRNWTDFNATLKSQPFH
ncbi:unnamed protein product [Onchocerca flexuosa]|uniref:Uncharacterized protein n=1 Tax=Onchocerca flexuosa TaxID=387005 RepID=A0A183H5M6_9BILA|nr:unnamed protein product [Onchocerca flexuosa]